MTRMIIWQPWGQHGHYLDYTVEGVVSEASPLYLLNFSKVGGVKGKIGEDQRLNFVYCLGHNEHRVIVGLVWCMIGG